MTKTIKGGLVVRSLSFAAILLITALGSLAGGAVPDPGLQDSQGKDKNGGPSFQVVMRAEIVDTAASKLGFATVGRSDAVLGMTTFKASDSAYVTLESGEFVSPSEASRYLQYRVGLAAKILSSATRTDNDGKEIGERAQIVLASGSSGITTSAIVWTLGKWLYVIKSHSLADCLELEKKYDRLN